MAPLYEPESKVLKGGYMGHSVGDYSRGSWGVPRV